MKGFRIDMDRDILKKSLLSSLRGGKFDKIYAVEKVVIELLVYRI
jgi:hypothetical protein